MSVDTQRTLAIVLTAVYTALLLVGFSSTLARAYQFRRRSIRAPRLLLRDIILVGGHAVSLVAVLGARASGSLASASASPMWWLLAGGAPVFAIAVYVYYELFVIGH